MIRLRTITMLAVLGTGLVGLSGCAATVAYLGIKAGTTIAQDRSVGAAIDDASINTAYNARLAAQSLTLYRHVNVKVVEGRVLLTGHVATNEDREAAARIGANIGGVRDVANELTVTESNSVGNVVHDLWISDQLRGKLMTDNRIAWVNYNVSTVDGTIYLLGIAKDQNELERVTLHARTIPGVKRVVSYVDVRPAPSERASL